MARSLTPDWAASCFCVRPAAFRAALRPFLCAWALFHCRRLRNLPHTSVLKIWKCGKNRVLLTRPRFYSSASCGFVAKNRIVLDGCRFSPQFRNSGVLTATRDAIKRSKESSSPPLVCCSSSMSLRALRVCVSRRPGPESIHSRGYLEDLGYQKSSPILFSL